jgi:hypothetical protein
MATQNTSICPRRFSREVSRQTKNFMTKKLGTVAMTAVSSDAAA